MNEATGRRPAPPTSAPIQNRTTPNQSRVARWPCGHRSPLARIAPFSGVDGLPRTDARQPRTPSSQHLRLREEQRSAGTRLARSAAQQGVDPDHRSVAAVDGVDDLGVVDALEVDRGDAELAVPEPARMTTRGTLSRPISTAWACRTWCGAKRRAIARYDRGRPEGRPNCSYCWGSERVNHSQPARTHC